MYNESKEDISNEDEKANKFYEMFNEDEPNIISSNISSIPKNNDINSFGSIDILKTVNSFSLLDTSNIFDISCMFYGCFSLISLPDISNWNTLNFRRINRVFFDCRSLNLYQI